MSSLGVTVNGHWSKSKKEIREALETDPGSVEVHDFSMFGEPCESVTDAAKRNKTFVVGHPQNGPRSAFGQFVLDAKHQRVTIR